jgi:hypothetical protein
MSTDRLPKESPDALIIVRFEIRRTVAKDGGGWMATSKGREYVRRLR